MSKAKNQQRQHALDVSSADDDILWTTFLLLNTVDGRYWLDFNYYQSDLTSSVRWFP